MGKSLVIQLLAAMLLLAIFSCNENKTLNNTVTTFSLWIPDTALRLVNGTLFYKQGKPFNGELKEAWENGKLKSIQRITNGKQQALSETFYEDGRKESTRWYLAGEKDSMHTGWWWNGNKKYEYHFKKGAYDGMFTEWYQNGKMIQQVMYAQGKELYGRGWRENGKLYMNFIMKNGRKYGMNNSNLCYGLKGETVSE